LEAIDLLRLVPDLSGEGTERRARLARWVHGLYPGPRWWNAIEPDLLGEHLVATCYSENPRILAGVLDSPNPASIVQPLDTYERAAADHPQLVAGLRPVLSQALGRLCVAAVEQAQTESDLSLLLGGTTLAAALERILAVVAVDPGVLAAALDSLPPRPDLVLGPLALTLNAQMVAVYRRLATANPAANQPDLAMSLHNLSLRLAEAGRHDDAERARSEAVDVEESITRRMRGPSFKSA
jgi:hypothetical protein